MARNPTIVLSVSNETSVYHEYVTLLEVPSRVALPQVDITVNHELFSSLVAGFLAGVSYH